MRIVLTGRNVALTDAMREMLEKKARKLEKYFPKEAVLTATLSMEKNRKTVEITIASGDVVIRGEDTSYDLYASLDKVIARIERQIGKYRTQLSRRMHAVSLYEAMAEMEEEPDEEEPALVRRKKFVVKPMELEEAIMQMELVEHDFYVFVNPQTQQTNVLYRRKDGNLGLIEPELG